MTHDPREAFQQYRRKQIAELRPWQDGDLMTGISVSAEDRKAGSPKPGDMIARNPKNHADQWLVAEAYFADNFEPLTASAPGEQQPVAHRIRVVDGSYCKVIPAGELEIWKQNWSMHLKSGHALLEPLYTSPPPAVGCPDWGQIVQSLLRSMDHPFKGESSSEQAERMADDLCKKYPALRREAPAPEGVAKIGPQFDISQSEPETIWDSDDRPSTEARLREAKQFVKDVMDKINDATAKLSTGNGGPMHPAATSLLGLAIKAGEFNAAIAAQANEENAGAEARLRDHKWFDHECQEKGCQSLTWKGLYETAVKGRADFRGALRIERENSARLREALANLHGAIKRLAKIGSNKVTLFEDSPQKNPACFEAWTKLNDAQKVAADVLGSDFKLHFSTEWLASKIKSDPDTETDVDKALSAGGDEAKKSEDNNSTKD